MIIKLLVNSVALSLLFVHFSFSSTSFTREHNSFAVHRRIPFSIDMLPENQLKYFYDFYEGLNISAVILFAFECFVVGISCHSLIPYNSSGFGKSSTDRESQGDFTN